MGAHTHVSVRVHFVFATAHRDCAIPADFQTRLFAYIAGIARNLGALVYAVGGMRDHAHVFIGLPPTLPVATAAQKIKANSSRWLRESANLKKFAWQEGYGAFSVGVSQTDATVAYVRNQAEHHRHRGYGEELALMLARHNMRAA